jgi:ATP-dependent helicase/nuclease subunit A
MEPAVSNATPEFLKRHQIVRAGAGAGKTYTLTHKVMDIADEIFQKEKRWPRVVVTTFTRKATQELRERLMLLALEEKPHLVDFINSRSHLMVSTIHGVMDLFLKRYGANICVDPGYSVISGAQATKLARQVLRLSLLEEGGDSALLETFPFNRLTTLVRKLDAMYGEDPEAKPYSTADFESIFDRRAKEIARELESAAFNIKEESTKANWLKMAEDYQALSSILKQDRWKENRSRFESTLKAMGKAPPFTKKNPPVTDMTNDEAKSALKKAKTLLEPMYDPSAWQHFAERYQTLDRVGRKFSEDFRKAKREKGWLEISDLELLAMECARAHPEATEAFSSEWDHWLIDEYQDTSPFQVRLLRELTGEEPCFVVGDPQQSIYLFRGARSEVFGQREEEILSGGGERKLLTVNRRSHPELLLFLNDFFGRLNPPFVPMEPFLEGGKKVESSKLVAEIFISGGLSDTGGETPSGDDDKEEESTAISASADTDEDETNHDEMKAIVAHVQKLMDAGSRPDEICILARTNGTLTEVAEWLSRYGLPTHVHAASGFFDRRETRDALALLKFLVNPHDAFNTLELLRSPCFRVPDRTLVEVSSRRPSSLWEALVAQMSLSDEMTAVRKLDHLLEEVEEWGLTGAFRKGLLESGFIDLSHVHDTSGRRESNIWKLLAKLEAEEGRSGFNPLSFVTGTAAELKIEEGGGEGDAVAAVEPDRINLMTIHASKGLEFRHVILPRMHQKPRLTPSEEFFFDPEARRWAARIPYGENGDMTGSLPERDWVEAFRQQELQEHARVLYVALTRAIESVFLSWTEPKKPDSWADMIRLDLGRGRHVGESYTYSVSDTPVEPRETRELEFEEVQVRPKWMNEEIKADNALGVLPGMEAPTSLSVTEMLDRKPGLVLSSDSERDVSRRLKIAATGTAVHKLMELLKYPSQDVLGRLVSKWFPKQEDKVLDAIEFVRNASAPPLMEIISSGEVEWGFAMLERGILIEGQVDLWGRSPDGTVWIIDYKTGNPEMRSKAFEQMSLYTLALRKSGLIRADETLKLAAVYPFAKLIYIEDEPKYEDIIERFGMNRLKADNARI